MYSSSNKADFITIGQWIENKICFGSFEKPFTSPKKYEEIGELFVRYVKMIEDGLICLPKDELFDYEIHAAMKNLVAYRLTPHAIDFVCSKLEGPVFKMDDDICDNHYSKTIMYLSDRALCNLRITIKPWDLSHANFHIRDYFGEYPNEKYVVELDGLESLEKGEGKALVRETLFVLQDVPVLLQAGFLHYGDYECELGMERVEALAKFYESLGFENVNDTIGNYEESIMMLAHKDKIKEFDDIEKD